MPITGLFTKSRPRIGNLYFDALIKESSELRTDVSEYPLETAETAHDNAVTRALTLSMEIGVSDNWYRSQMAQQSEVTSGLLAPGGALTVGMVTSALSGSLAALGGIAASAAISVYETGNGASSRSLSLLEELRELQRSHTPFDLVAGRGASYQNCLITSTRTEMDKSMEGGLMIVVELVQLNITGVASRTTNNNLPYGDSAATQGQVETSAGELVVQELTSESYPLPSYPDI